MRIKKLNLSDIESPNDLRKWIQSSLPHLYKNSADVTTEHMLIYVEYISNIINNYENIDRLVWLDKIRDLKTKIQSIKRTE